MKLENIALIIFALVALGAVFAFIFTFRGSPTGEVSIYQRMGTSSYTYLDAVDACKTSINCRDGLPGVPTGVVDEYRGLYECRCVSSDKSTTFWRSPFR